MTRIVEKERKLPIVAHPDVLVVGAGPAGIGAALAAARNGAKTLLIERYGFVGGGLTQTMVNPMFTFHDVKGRQIIQGIAEEFVQKLMQYGASKGHMTDLTFDNASMTPFDPERAKVVLLEMLESADVELLLHTMAVDVQVKSGRIEAVIIESKSGRQAICPRYVIDCSADADVAYFAGVPTVKGRAEDHAMQPVTLYFRLGGVDEASLRQWMKRNRTLLKDTPTDEEIDAQRGIALLGLNQLIKEAVDAGELDREVAPRILMYQLPLPGQFSVNSTRLQNIDGTDAKALTYAEIVLRKQVIQLYDFIKKHIGGFKTSYIIDTATQVGVRETRHIVGDYVLTEQDILSGTPFVDGVCCGTFAIDIHPPFGKQQIFTGSGRVVYEIPYRSLVPQGINNLLVAGRGISVTHVAFGSIRVMATCMAMGQGAGVAAGLLSMSGSTSTREVNVKLLRQRLLEQGQYLLGENLEEKVTPALVLQRSGGSGEKACHYNPFATRCSSKETTL